MLLQIRYSFVFSCVLSASLLLQNLDSFLDQDNFAKLHRIFQFIKENGAAKALVNCN